MMPVMIGPKMPDRLPSAFWTPIQVPAARGPANIWATAYRLSDSEADGDAGEAQQDRRARPRCLAWPMPKMAMRGEHLAGDHHPAAHQRPPTGPSASSGPRNGRSVSAASRLDRIAERREPGSFRAMREAALLDQVERQPGEQEIEAVIARGMADAHRP